MSAKSKERAASESDDPPSKPRRTTWKIGVDATGDGTRNFVFKTKGGLLAAVTAVVVAFIALDLLITGGETIRAILS